MVNSSPFLSHISIRLLQLEFDRAEIEIDLGQEHLQPYGKVHGGVIASMIDTATFWAGFMRIDENAAMVNVDLKLNYIKPAVSGRLRAEGRAIYNGKTVSYTEARVFDDAGDLVAHGTSTLMILPGKSLPSKHPKFVE